MSNILVVGKYYAPFQGGTEAYTQDICDHLAEKHNVVALVHNHLPGNTDEREHNVRVLRCATPLRIKGQPISPSMLWRIFGLKADLVHFHGPNFFATIPLLLKLAFTRKRVPVIITHHMDVEGRKFLRALALPFYRALMRKSAAVIVTSKKNSDRSQDLAKQLRTVPIPLGLDLAKFQLSAEFRADSLSWRKATLGDKPMIAFVGRHARYKGLDVLIDAMRRLPDVHAVICGDGPYRASAEAYAREAAVQDRAHFVGSVDFEGKMRVLAAADVFVFPSTDCAEAFGIGLLEAMALGVPVIASDLPTGVTDVAVDGRTALTFPPRDSAGLAQRIRALLNDQELAARLSTNARQHVLDNFNQSCVLQQFDDLMCSVLSSAQETSTTQQQSSFLSRLRVPRTGGISNKIAVPPVREVSSLSHHRHKV